MDTSLLLSRTSPEAALHTLLLSTPGAVAVLDPAGTVLLWNPAAERLFGWTEAEVLGRPTPVVTSGREAHFREQMLRALRGEHVVAFDTDRRRKDGSTFPASVWAVALHDQAHQPVAVLWMTIDLSVRLPESERAALAREIEFERAQLVQVLRQMPAGVIICEAPSGRIILGNEQMARIFRQPVKRSDSIDEYGEWIGYHLDGRPYAPEEWPLARSISTGEIVTNEEIRIARGDGTEGIVLANSAPIRDAEGQIIAGVVTDIDVTETRAAQHALELAQGKALEQAVRAREAAESLSRAKDHFFAAVSHEIRTPLNSVLGWARLLARGDLAPEARERAVAAIERNALATTKMIEDLLEGSRMLVGKTRIETRPVDPVLVVQLGVESVLPAAEAKGVRVRTDLNAAGLQIPGDALRLQQALWNLLTNAVRFTPAGGEVIVSLRQGDPGTLDIVVSDTGEGISAEDLPHIFDRFWQADAERDYLQQDGFGLGLSIVRHIIELHGGSIHAESEGRHRGATFVVRLPTDVAVRPALSSRAQRADATLREARVSLQRIRVQIVEDDRDAREVMHALLIAAGAEVQCSNGPGDALRHFIDFRPHVIVIDVAVEAGGDGYELVRSIRALSREEGGQTPAVAVSMYGRAEDRTRALALGFQAFIQKPVDAAELVATVSSLARVVDSQR